MNPHSCIWSLYEKKSTHEKNLIQPRQIDGVKVEIVTDISFLSFKITVDGNCSHGIKRCLLLEGKAMTNLDSIFKSKDITLLKKDHIVKAMVFQQSSTDVRVGSEIAEH